MVQEGVEGHRQRALQGQRHRADPPEGQWQVSRIGFRGPIVTDMSTCSTACELSWETLQLVAISTANQAHIQQ